MLQENEQFRKQEERRLAREQKKAEEEAKRIAAGGSKIKIKKTTPQPEETCIIDKLMDEIKHGFPLKKRSLGEGARAASPSHKKDSSDSIKALMENRKASMDSRKSSSDSGGKSPIESRKGSREPSRLDTFRKASLLTSFLRKYINITNFVFCLKMGQCIAYSTFVP